MRPALRTLIESAILAPSGDNMQPWRFISEENGPAIDVCIDSQRDMSPMNVGQRMSRIAVGAAVENMLNAAEHNGWTATVTSETESQITIQLQGNAWTEPKGDMPELLRRRVTNRKLFDGSAIPQAEIKSLEQRMVSPRDVRAVWIADPESIKSLASVIGRADALMFGIGEVRRAFLENVRRDRPRCEAVESGLSLASLELGW